MKNELGTVRSHLRPHDWALFASVGAALAAIVSLANGELWWAAALLIVASVCGTAVWRLSRARPSPMPQILRWLLLLPRGNLSPSHFLAVLDPKPGEHLLEVGPGIGVHAVPVAAALGSGGTLSVLDIQPAMLADLARRAERAGVQNIKPQLGDAQKLPYPDSTFDAAYVVTVLGELPDRHAALGELRRVLKRGGRLVIGEFALDPDFIPLQTLKVELTAAGFSVEQVSGFKLSYIARFRSPN